MKEYSEQLERYEQVAYEGGYGGRLAYGCRKRREILCHDVRRTRKAAYICWAYEILG